MRSALHATILMSAALLFASCGLLAVPVGLPFAPAAHAAGLALKPLPLLVTTGTIVAAVAGDYSGGGGQPSAGGGQRYPQWSGCCSYHRGVAGCDYNAGWVVCNDRNYSPTCGCGHNEGVRRPGPP